jgi:hypothetical protein
MSKKSHRESEAAMIASHSASLATDTIPNSTDDMTANTPTPHSVAKDATVAPLLTVRDCFVRTFPQYPILGTDLAEVIAAFEIAGSTGVVSARLDRFVLNWSHITTAEAKYQEAVHLLRGRRAGRYSDVLDLAVAWLDWRVTFHTIATRIFLEDQRYALEADEGSSAVNIVNAIDELAHLLDVRAQPRPATPERRSSGVHA